MTLLNSQLTDKYNIDLQFRLYAMTQEQFYSCHKINQLFYHVQEVFLKYLSVHKLSPDFNLVSITFEICNQIY